MICAFPGGLMAVLFTLSGTAFAQTPLLLAIGEADVPPGVGALAQWPVVLDAASLRTADTLDLNIPGYPRTVARDSVELRANGGYRWHGKIDDLFDVLLTSDGTYVHGRVGSPTGEFVIRPLSVGHVLQQVDPSAEPPPGEPIDPKLKTSPLILMPPPADAPKATQAIYTIDVMVLYTPQAREEAGGDAQIRNFAQNMIDLHNQIFINSLVHDTEYRLRHVGLINAPDPGDSHILLDDLRQSSTVGKMRQIYGIDTVMLVVKSFTNPPSGSAYAQRQPGPGFAPYSLGVVLHYWSEIGYTFQHEGGHILGMEHDPDDAPPPDQVSFPWSYGHKDQPMGFDGPGFRTVMAYDGNCGNPCIRVPFYSQVYFKVLTEPFFGAPMGIPDHAENTRTGYVIAPGNSQFYPETDAIFVDGFDDRIELNP